MTSSLPLSALDRFGGRVTVRVVPGGPVTPTSLPRGTVPLRGEHLQVLRRRTRQVA